MNEHHRWNHAPDPYVELHTIGTIEEVYDAATVRKMASSNNINSELSDKLARNPGLTYAKVAIPSGGSLYLPFHGSTSELYATHGNAGSLKGKTVRISYRNLDIRSGTFKPVSGYSLPLGLEQVTAVLDLLGII